MLRRVNFVISSACTAGRQLLLLLLLLLMMMMMMMVLSFSWQLSSQRGKKEIHFVCESKNQFRQSPGGFLSVLCSSNLWFLFSFFAFSFFFVYSLFCIVRYSTHIHTFTFIDPDSIQRLSVCVSGSVCFTSLSKVLTLTLVFLCALAPCRRHFSAKRKKKSENRAQSENMAWHGTLVVRVPNYSMQLG